MREAQSTDPAHFPVPVGPHGPRHGTSALGSAVPLGTRGRPAGCAVPGVRPHRLWQRHGRHGEAGAGQRHPHPGPAGGEWAAAVHAVQDPGGGPAGGPQGGQHSSPARERPAPGDSEEVPSTQRRSWTSPGNPPPALLLAPGALPAGGFSCACCEDSHDSARHEGVYPPSPLQPFEPRSLIQKQTFPPLRADRPQEASQTWPSEEVVDHRCKPSPRPCPLWHPLWWV